VNYADFVDGKLSRVPPTGLSIIPELSATLFPFQKDLVTWALRRGRCAIFADTGLGKTRQELEWARCVAQATGGRVLILAPLAVGAQTVREAEKIGIDAKQVRYASDIDDACPAIVVTNYDRIHHFDASAFVGVVCDESSVIKNSDSKTFATLTEMFAATPFRLCATATPSPNDYTELGTHAEFLGICTKEEMLAEYFCHDGGETQTWRLKGHARGAFWRWVAGWAALIRKPSDFGYSDSGYDLPPLIITQHTIAADPEQAKEQGLLFAEPARTLTERRAARKASLTPRVQECANIVLAEPNEPWIVWCELNAEADALTDALTGAVEIRGSDDTILKEQRLVAFSAGDYRILVSKSRICGFGLNWQHCARMAFVGVKDSYESTYQAIRRCWRFGQTRPVHVHVFASELEGEVVKNLERKERDALAMSEALSVETREVVRAEILGQKRQTNTYGASTLMGVPPWL
jgi:superfamily II DNA or RNA helicase